MVNYYFTSYHRLLLPLFLIIATTAEGQQSSKKDFTLQLDNFQGQIQWEQSFDLKIWAEIPNGNTGKLKVIPTMTTYYRAKITDPGCNPVYSKVKAAFFDGNDFIGAQLAEGKVTIPADFEVKIDELKVLSFLEENTLEANGNFHILLPDSVEEDVIIITNKEDEVVMLSHFRDQDEEYLISSETTAEALLVMHPLNTPIPSSEKPRYLALQKKEIEFQQLVDKVAELNKEGKPLFSEQNIDIIHLLSVLIQKDMNRDGSGMRTASTDPIFIRSSGTSSVTLANTSYISYTGQIYNVKDDKPIGAKFNIAGSMVRNSILASELVKYWRGPVNVKHNEVTYDLKNSYNLEPGEYEILVRNGFASETSPENDEAVKQNMTELLALVITNYISFAVPLKDNCIKSFINAQIATINPIHMAEAAQERQVFANYVFPILKELGNAGVYCSDVSKALVQLTGILNLVDESLPIAWYIGEWVLEEAQIDGCQYLNQDYETSNCFEIESAESLDDQYFPGDTVELKVKAIEKKNYYPYTGDPAAFKDFTWLKTGGSIFSTPDAVDLHYDKTDVKGKASIQWILSCEEEINSVKTWVMGIESTLSEDIYTTNTFVPELAIVKDGDNQEGEKGKDLPKPISFSIKDLGDGLPTLLNRFNIKWEVLIDGIWKEVQEGENINDSPNNSTPTLLVSKNWTLLNEDAEQKIRATINDKCGKAWNIKGNPVVFTANDCLSSNFSLTVHSDGIKATAVASGGLPPYTYSWNKGTVTGNVFNDLSKIGNIEVTAIDANGCTVSRNDICVGIVGNLVKSPCTDQSFDLYLDNSFVARIGQNSTRHVIFSEEQFQKMIGVKTGIVHGHSSQVFPGQECKQFITCCPDAGTCSAQLCP